MGFRFEHLEGDPVARIARRLPLQEPPHRAVVGNAPQACAWPRVVAAAPREEPPVPPFDHAQLVAEAEPPSHAGALGTVLRGALASLACVGAVGWPLAALGALGAFILLLLTMHGMLAVAHACQRARIVSRARRIE